MLIYINNLNINLINNLFLTNYIFINVRTKNKT